MSCRLRYQQGWDVRASKLARNTINPIREIIETLQIKPNPNKTYIPLSVVMIAVTNTGRCSTEVLDVVFSKYHKIENKTLDFGSLFFTLLIPEVFLVSMPDAIMICDPTVFGNLQPPVNVINAICDAVKLNESRNYGPTIGHRDARQAVAEYSAHQGRVTEDDVILCSGCSHAIDITLSVLADVGQNVLIPRPGYLIHKTLGEGLGIVIKYYDLLPDHNWEVDIHSLENQIDENTAAIVVNNPSNPCGSVYSKQHLKDIIDIASRYRVPIIADEIYEHIVFSNEEFTALSSVSEDVPVLTCSGVTKRFLIPGWRLGWVIIHDRQSILGEDVRNGLLSMSTRLLGPCTLIQKALPRILKETPHVFFDETIRFIESQAKIAYQELQKAPGLRPIMPQGSMYMMIEIKTSRFPKFKDELQFITQLCNEQSVLCIPGECFNYPNFMRIVLTVPENILREACFRIKDFCEDHIATNSLMKNENNLVSKTVLGHVEIPGCSDSRDPLINQLSTGLRNGFQYISTVIWYKVRKNFLIVFYTLVRSHSIKHYT